MVVTNFSVQETLKLISMKNNIGLLPTNNLSVHKNCSHSTQLTVKFKAVQLLCLTYTHLNLLPSISLFERVQTYIGNKVDFIFVNNIE